MITRKVGPDSPPAARSFSSRRGDAALRDRNLQDSGRGRCAEGRYAHYGERSGGVSGKSSSPTQGGKLTFTGSTAVGKMLAGKAAANMRRVSCELGGHAPFMVFEDANPVHAAKGAQLVKFLNTGQACISPNRMGT